MIALALAGRTGARLVPGLDLTAGRSGILRLIMALPDPETGTVTVPGVDDFAFRRGRITGPSWSTRRPASPWTCCATARQAHSPNG